jgi:hypothetical protein
LFWLKSSRRRDREQFYFDSSCHSGEGTWIYPLLYINGNAALSCHDHTRTY